MIPAAPEGRLPDGFAVRLDPRVRRRDGGSALPGGSPLRLLRLAPRAYLAYGAGLWWGAVRGRDLTALLPARPE